LRDPPETQNSRSGADHAGAERVIEDQNNSFDPTEIHRIVKTKKLQLELGLLPATACMIAELAFFAGGPQ
jgi:hypothetical protein